MKKSMLILALANLMIVTSCKKDEVEDPNEDPTGGGTPALVCTLTQEIKFDPAGTDMILDYSYNPDGTLAKITETQDGNTDPYTYDTIYYTAGGEIDKIDAVDFVSGMVYSSSVYTYTNGNITSILEYYDNLGTLELTDTYSYSYDGAGNLTTATSVDNLGNPGMAFENIVFTNGNISSLSLDMDGTGANLIALNVTTDDKANVRGMGILDTGFILESIGDNNITAISLVSATDLGSGVVSPAGTKLLDRSNLYDSDNVSQITDHITVMNSDERVSTYSFDCQ